MNDAHEKLVLMLKNKEFITSHLGISFGESHFLHMTLEECEIVNSARPTENLWIVDCGSDYLLFFEAVRENIAIRERSIFDRIFDREGKIKYVPIIPNSIEDICFSGGRPFKQNFPARAIYASKNGGLKDKVDNLERQFLRAIIKNSNVWRQKYISFVWNPYSKLFKVIGEEDKIFMYILPQLTKNQNLVCYNVNKSTQ